MTSKQSTGSYHGILSVHFKETGDDGTNGATTDKELMSSVNFAEGYATSSIWHSTVELRKLTNQNQ